MQSSSLPSVSLVTTHGTLLTVHHWPAFWTVVCLGLIQVTVTYYGSTLTIESLPGHVPDTRKRRHKRVFAMLFIVFVGLTFLLAKLNDSNQHRSEVLVEQERMRQEILQMQLRQTLDAVLDSQEKLQRIKQAVDAHPPGVERSAMLDSIDQIQQNLQQQATSMRQVTPR